MPRVGFEPTISAGERPKIYALDRAATGTGDMNLGTNNIRLVTSTPMGPRYFKLQYVYQQRNRTNVTQLERN